MQAFGCPTCRRLVFFHNFHCLSCGAGLGYDPDTRSIVARGGGVDEPWRSCGNRVVADCNWLIPASDANPLCRSCRLTTVRPNDAEAAHLAAFADAESAKRQVLDQLTGLGLPIGAAGGGPPQLRFRLMASSYERVVTGYEEGTITLDLSESDDAHRERVRQHLGEVYRTVLGHLRHEIGHFYWWLLIAPFEHLGRFRKLFGDEQVGYQAALDQHYSQTAGRPIALGSPGPWSDHHISVYATAHPWEDWAET
ncbi:MAG: putative zinc-binding metallopeptidase, partial [Acidimicrobiia bacterium]|nr:putative zinc-binding metallopeptidase [Acidimicrobiia bacterium]